MLITQTLEGLSATKIISTKEAIFFIIGYCPGVSCTQAKKILRKKFNLDLSTQGVYKVLSELIENKMVSKNELGYYANLNWVEQTKRALEEIQERTNSKEELVLIV